jgi:type I restriction enzyme, S subunit
MREPVCYPRYEAYQPAHSPWLLEVPSHWKLLPGLAVLKENKDKNIGMIEETVLSLSYGKIIIKPLEKLTGLVPESFETYQIIKPNDIIIRPTDLQNDHTSLRTGIARDRGIITSAYICLRPNPSHNPTFIHYLLHAYDLLKVFYGMGSGLRQNLDYRDFKHLEFCIPIREEQDRIANFLDQKTAEIDEAIAKKQRLIELLKEQKAILINRAVTCGLNPDAPMRDSGVEWIGEVPEHWEVRGSKYLFTQRKEAAGKDDVQLSATQAYGVIPQEQYEKIIGRRVVKIQLHLEKRKHVEIDDFVISMRSFQGGLERAWATGCIRSSYVILKPVEAINTSYFSYLFKSHAYILALQTTGNFIRDGQDLNFNNFALVDLPIPPIQEQLEIAEFLKGWLEYLKKATDQLYQHIELLKELGTSIISEAVTGKIKV